MNILVACEESQVVATAFRERGHDAFSCDILPCSGEHPEWHFECDVTPWIDSKWDMVLAFPPCTHISVSGARYFEQKRKDGRQQEGIDFFMLFTELDVEKVCIENPVGIMSSLYRKPDQIIQPWQFGHNESKKTCLWLKNLPLLVPTNVIPGTIRDNQTPSGQNKLGPSVDRARIRSRTYEGIARAMAEQWG